MLSRYTTYVDKFLTLSRNCFDLNQKPNRVEIKRAILDATLGLPIEPFVKSLSTEERNDLIKCATSECPVTCSKRTKIDIAPIESSPLRIINSCKKLRHYFAISESQACRGCVKRTRCKFFLKVDQGVPDLSDVSLMTLGMYNMCRLYIDKCELIKKEEDSVSNINSFISVLNYLEQYLLSIKERSGSLKVPHGNYKECSIESCKIMKQNLISKLQHKISEMYNIPSWMSLSLCPRNSAKMTKNQRLLQNKLDRLLKRDKDDENNAYIWVPEHNFNENEEIIDNSDESATRYSLNLGNETKVIQLDSLNNEEIEFRLNRNHSELSNEEIKQYDISTDKIIRSIKNNNSTTVDLNNTVNHDYSQYVSRYKGSRLYNVGQLTKFLDSIEPRKCKDYLPNIIRVPFEAPSQSSGDSIPPIIDRKDTVGYDSIKWEPLKTHEFNQTDEININRHYIEDNSYDEFEININQSESSSYFNNDLNSAKLKDSNSSHRNNYQDNFQVWKLKNGATVSKNLTFPSVKKMNE